MSRDDSNVAWNEQSYYHATATEPRPQASSLAESLDVDVCVIGGGFTGVTAALHLARLGRSVVLVEQAEIGSGASGRNGGQVHLGLRRDPKWFETRMGADTAQHFWSLSLEARQHLDWLIRTFDIDAQYQPGLLHLCHKQSYVQETLDYVDYMMTHYPGADLRFVDAKEARSLVDAEGYYGGYLDHRSGHLHALNLVLGTARAARQLGARLYERTRAMRVHRKSSRWLVQTEHGSVTADNVVLAGDGHLRDLQPQVEARVMPINNFILTTQPLGAARAEALIRDRLAVSDSRFVVYYYRITPDERLLFGGGETYSLHFPHDIAGMVRKHMLRIFPQLSDVGIDHAWGGTFGITTSRLPYVREIEPSLFNASGYSGLGVVMAPFVGKLLADKINGDARAFDLLAQLPVSRFPGGRHLRWPVLAAGMSWYALLDRL